MGQNGYVRFILASTSPARLALLQQAGIEPEVIAPEVDEELRVAAHEAEHGPLTPDELVQMLARAKAEAVAELVDGDALVFGGDSAFVFEGELFGKPHTPEVAEARWRAHNGKTGTLWSGHWLIRTGSNPHEVGRPASAEVTFAELSDNEIRAYVATGEPLAVAGAFTLDSLGGPFIREVVGDPSTVVGLSLSVLRELARECGVPWESLWGRGVAGR